MKFHVLLSLYTWALFVTTLESTLLTQTLATSLCEARCVTATPNLERIRSIWHKMSKRIGKEDMSFAAFVQSLVAAASRYAPLRGLRANLLAMIEQYQDCVKACEHQHSKRTSERASDSFITPALCLWKGFCF